MDTSFGAGVTWRMGWSFREQHNRTNNLWGYQLAMKLKRCVTEMTWWVMA